MTDKTKKYDRQLRLWGDHGQTAIESARVCLINAGPTGTEILKNLVLPGLGSFTIIDPHVVTKEDVSCNFFLDKSSIGINRGKATLERLLELNSDTKGDYFEESLEEMLENHTSRHDGRHDGWESGLLTTFHVVIACDVFREDSIVRLSRLLYPLNIPLFLVRTNGPLGLVRLQVKEHVVVEAKPDSVLEDLRLDAPFPSLQHYLDSFDLDRMDRKTVSHVPFVVILHRMLCLWRRENSKKETDIPSNYKEKEQLRTLIRNKEKEINKSFTEQEQRDLDLTNFEEAVKGVNSVLIPSNQMPSNTKEIMDDKNEKDGKNSTFWTLVSALKLFVDMKGVLPVRGSIPDMTCDSASYVRLQKVYSDKKDEDVSTLGHILASLSPSVDNSCSLTESEIKNFCKNTHSIRVIRTPCFADELKGSLGEEREPTCPVVKKLKEYVMQEEMTNDMESKIGHLILFKAVDLFFQKFNREPGSSKERLDEDIVSLKSCFRHVLSRQGISCSSGSRDDLISSYVMFGGSRLHAVSSFIGGVVGQEVIKLLTRQYVPISHSLVYDAISNSVHTLGL